MFGDIKELVLHRNSQTDTRKWWWSRNGSEGSGSACLAHVISYCNEKLGMLDLAIYTVCSRTLKPISFHSIHARIHCMFENDSI